MSDSVNIEINGQSYAAAKGEMLIEVADQGALDVMQFMRYPDFDSYTIGHSVRVAALGVLVAKALGWSRELQHEIATAGLLHDLVCTETKRCDLISLSQPSFIKCFN